MPIFAFQALAGLLLVCTGCGTGFITLEKFNNDNSLFFVMLEIAVIGVGIFFLFKSRKNYATAKERAFANAEKARLLNHNKGHERFEQISDMIEEYGKASAQKDKLKVLQYAATEDTTK